MRRALLAAVLGAAITWGQPRAVADDAGPSRDVHLAFLRAVHRTLGPRATRRVLEDLHTEAKAATALHVRGRAHLSGRIVVSRFVVEPGAEVTVERGTVIYVAGDMTIGAPIVMTPRADVRGKAVVGTNGANQDDVAILCEGDGTISSNLTGTAGGPGQDVTASPAARGGPGGRGGGFEIACQRPLTVGGTISPGPGGKGGAATATGTDGAGSKSDAGSASAEAGDGGGAGSVKIAAPSVDFTNPDGSIDLADGGAGGSAQATGGNGGLNIGRGGNGGDAVAKAGNAGKGTVASVHLLGKGGAVTGQVGKVTSRSVGAPGGSATAHGGSGSSAIGIPQDACPNAGYPGGPGGRSGAATATGGRGGQAPILEVKGGSQTSTSEGVPGRGGDATADTGAAGPGGHGNTARHPGHGGKGGDSGKVRAVGAAGGGAKTVTGGAGGDATAAEGKAGDGGDGGSCCENPGGKGAAGGDPGRVGAGKVAPGKGGKGAPDGPEGKLSFGEGGPSVSGARGADCPGGGGTGGGITYAGPLTDIAIYSSGGDTKAWYIDGDIYNPTDAPISVEVRVTVDYSPFGVPTAETVLVPAKSGASNGHAFVGRAGPITKGHHKARIQIDGQVAAVVEFDVN